MRKKLAPKRIQTSPSSERKERSPLPSDNFLCERPWKRCFEQFFKLYLVSWIESIRPSFCFSVLQFSALFLRSISSIYFFDLFLRSISSIYFFDLFLRSISSIYFFDLFLRFLPISSIYFFAFFQSSRNVSNPCVVSGCLNIFSKTL
jgi:hypothetical protein